MSADYSTLGPIGGAANTPGGVTPTTINDDPDSDPNTLLFKALSSTHPDYAAWEDRWRVYRDVVDDAEFDKERYLFRNEREHEDQYRFRVSISEFLPDTPSYVERIVGALYNEKPKRDLKKHPDLADFCEAVERSQRSSLGSMDAFMEKTIRSLLTFGSMRALVTTQKTDTNATRAEEQAAGDRPYLVLYSPLSVIDWDEDESCELTMARIREQYCRKRDPEDPASPHVEYVRFIQYDTATARWWVFRRDDEKKEKWILERDASNADGVAHDMGIVPLVVHYWPDCYKTMIGRSFIRYMARAEVSRFRNDSDLDYDSYMHAHPALVLETRVKTAEEVVIGAGRYIKLDPGDPQTNKESAYYLDYPTPSFNVLTSVIESKKTSVRKYAAVDPSGVIDEAAATTTSGVARAWSFGTSEARTLSSLADAAAEIEARIFEYVLLAYGETPGANGKVFQGQVQYPEDFDVGGVDALLEKAEKIAANVNSPTLLRYVHKRIARAEAGDAAQELLDKIDSEIDKNPVLGEAVREDVGDLFAATEATNGNGTRPPVEDMEGEAEEEDIPPPAAPPRARARAAIPPPRPPRS